MTVVASVALKVRKLLAPIALVQPLNLLAAEKIRHSKNPLVALIQLDYSNTTKLCSCRFLNCTVSLSLIDMDAIMVLDLLYNRVWWQGFTHLFEGIACIYIYICITLIYHDEDLLQKHQ